MGNYGVDTVAQMGRKGVYVAGRLFAEGADRGGRV